jgi:hypothetical protein
MNFLLVIESPKFTAVAVVITVVIALLQRGCHVKYHLETCWAYIFVVNCVKADQFSSVNIVANVV